jgi:hypothetical protein
MLQMFRRNRTNNVYVMIRTAPYPAFQRPLLEPREFRLFPFRSKTAKMEDQNEIDTARDNK